MTTLNERAHALCDAMAANAEPLGIAVSVLPCGTRLIDCGVKAIGSVEAGRRLAEVCLSGLGQVEVVPADGGTTTHEIRVKTERPVVACMASQYAGWQITGEKFFAMGSGPMRAAAGREELFDSIGCREKPPVCVGILETSNLPPDAVCVDIATKCGVGPDELTLLTARTSSPAGTVQIVARSLETALHKLHVLGFELNRVAIGRGSAPLPPVAGDDLVAIGWTNDAILYGGIVDLNVRGDDTSLKVIGPKVSSIASADYGRPFAEIFARYDRDFYRIDPMLFSPAVVRLQNIDTGSTFEFGRTAPHVLAESFTKK
ncbi:MAG TPA: methenyltetrahydromethanopterin cyclohydrolase [Lacipirellulaceae bacterium]|nr:methenyltetrahydromethanopterin cyclohydrolase [Lacipirellulaceae bacterium]